MVKRNYLKAMVNFLMQAFIMSPAVTSAMNIRGETIKGDFSRFYGCKKCYNKKAKGLAIEARHNKVRSK